MYNEISAFFKLYTEKHYQVKENSNLSNSTLSFQNGVDLVITIRRENI